MYKTIFLFYNFMIRKIGNRLLQVWPCGLLYILLYIITYTIIFYYCDFHRRQDKRGKTTLAARSSPSWLPYPLALSLPQRWSEYELVYFWALCLFFLSARSVSSRVALRPERAVLNQPEFQGWLVRGLGDCVLSIDLCSGDDSHCAICRFSLVRSWFYLRVVIAPASPCAPNGSAKRRTEFQGWIELGLGDCVLSIDSTRAVSKKAADSGFFRPRMISLIYGRPHANPWLLPRGVPARRIVYSVFIATEKLVWYNNIVRFFWLVA